MNFNNNASKFYLLTNKPVTFWNEEGSFEVVLPSLEKVYSDNNLIFILSFFDLEKNDLQKMISTEISGHYAFIHLVLSLALRDERFKSIADELMNGLKTIIPKIEFNKILRVGDNIISEKTFNEIIQVIYLSLDKEKTIIFKDDDEFTKIEKEAKLRVEQIRKNSKKKPEKGSSIEDMLISILYEFPQYKIEDLMKMNLYTIYYLFKHVGKIANYEVSKIAAGNGLSKKHKYFVEK